MTADELAARLRNLGVVTRGVVCHPRSADILVVYLFENDQRCVSGEAMELMATVTGVLSVYQPGASRGVQYVRVHTASRAGDPAAQPRNVLRQVTTTAGVLLALDGPVHRDDEMIHVDRPSSTSTVSQMVRTR